MIFEESTAYLIALNLSKEMWGWLRDNPTKRAKDWLYYEKYKNKLFVAYCAICTARWEFKEESCEYIALCNSFGGTKGNMDACVFSNICKDHLDFWIYGTVEERKVYAEQACVLLQNEIDKFKERTTKVICDVEENKIIKRLLEEYK